MVINYLWKHRPNCWHLGCVPAQAPLAGRRGGGAAETLPQGSSGHGRPSIVRNISISSRTLFFFSYYRYYYDHQCCGCRWVWKWLCNVTDHIEHGGAPIHIYAVYSVLWLQWMASIMVGSALQRISNHYRFSTWLLPFSYLIFRWLINKCIIHETREHISWLLITNIDNDK